MTDEERRLRKRDAARRYLDKLRQDPERLARHQATQARCNAAWNSANADRKRELDRARWRMHQEQESLRNKEWCVNNPGKRAASRAARRIAEARASPEWLTAAERKMIQAIYEMASRLTKCTGIKHQVDHIVPIRGKNVCGLHTPWNMAVIPADLNRRKGNRFTVDQSLNYGKLPCLS